MTAPVEIPLGTRLTAVAPITSNATLVASKHTPVDATSGARAVTLPTGSIGGTPISLEKYDSTTNTVTVTGNIRGVGGTTIVVSLARESIEFVADSSGSWWPVAGHKTLSSLDGRFVLSTAVGVANGVASLGSDGKVPAGQLPTPGGAGSPSPGTPDFTITVSGSPNSATFTSTNRAGSTTSASDTSTASGLRTLLQAIYADNIHIHFSTGRFHFLDAPLGTESWANITGFGISQFRGIRFTGEGMNATIISCRSNTITASPDLGIFLFTNCSDMEVTDMTIEFCGAYQATMEAINCNQGNRYRIQRVKFNRSKSTTLTMDGGDVGKSSRYSVIRDCVFEGRPRHPQIDYTSTGGGGGLTNGGSYQYAVAWRDMDLAYYEGATASVTGGVATVTLGGSDTHDMIAGEQVTLQGASLSAYNGRFTLLSASTTQFTFTLGGSPAAATGITVVGPGTTKPSDPSTAVAITSTTGVCKVWAPIGPYTTTKRFIYRYDGTSWSLVQTLNDNTTVSWTDTGVAGGTAPAFGGWSTIPHSAIQLLATRGHVVQGNTIDGMGTTLIAGAANQGIRAAQKQSVSCDRNIISNNIIRGSAGSNIFVGGGSDNVIEGNVSSNPGTVAVKAQAIRLGSSGSVNSFNNLVVNNRCFDDQTAASPSGGVSTSPSISILSGSNNNVVRSNMLSGSAVTVSVSDAGTGNVVEDNFGFNASAVTISTGAPPTATANNKNTWYLRTDLNGGTLYLSSGTAWVQVAAGVSASGGSGHIIADEGSALTARATLDFVGAGVTVTDDSTNSKTVVTIPAGSYTPPGAIPLPFVSAATSLTWTSMPSAETEFTGQRTRTAYDLSTATDMRLTARILTTAGVTGSLVKVQYSTTAAPTTWIDICTCPIDSIPSSGVQKGSWTAIPVGAKADVNLRLAGIGGDGTVSPGFGNIIAHVR